MTRLDHNRAVGQLAIHTGDTVRRADQPIPGGVFTDVVEDLADGSFNVTALRLGDFAVYIWAELKFFFQFF